MPEQYLEEISRRNAAGKFAGRRPHDGRRRKHITRQQAARDAAHRRANSGARPRVATRPPRKHAAVDRQSGPRPESSHLRQPVLEGLTNSARMEIPQRGGRNKSGEEAAARGWPTGGAWVGREERWAGQKLPVKLIGTSPIRARGGGRRRRKGGGRRREFPCGNHESSTCVTLNGSGIQLAVGPQPLWLQNHNFGLAQRIMVKRLATSPHDPLGITDSACKNQLVMVSVQYGPFNTYIPIRSTTIGKSRVVRDPIDMHTSWRSNSYIASVTSIGYQLMRASGESSTTKHRLLYESGPHPIPPPNDPNAEGSMRLRSVVEFRGSCHRCGQLGHFSIVCPLLRGQSSVFSQPAQVDTLTREKAEETSGIDIAGTCFDGPGNRITKQIGVQKGGVE
ncbi:hypothetical protein F511_40428 [Dorcoceras hygrometricum]|uniref:CCHC-type domain-containing protein n=1 Tax=Dorcoceras hygrometricum TaxID=472368 RepID=A0A2Z7C191_9LAMI|nr:hypothetical protein F511_40428 [Dorcoceras hygrometricum]